MLPLSFTAQSEVCGPLPLDCHFLRGEIKRPGRGPHPFLTKPTSQHLLWRPTPTPQKGHQDTQTVPRHARGVGQLKAPAGWVSGCPRQTDERGGCASPHFRPALSSCLLQPAEAGAPRPTRSQWWGFTFTESFNFALCQQQVQFYLYCPENGHRSTHLVARTPLSLVSCPAAPTCLPRVK